MDQHSNTIGIAREATLGELAAMIGGQVIGDASLRIFGAAPLYEVVSGQITLVDGVGQSLEGNAETGFAASAFVTGAARTDSPHPQIIASDPRGAFAQIVEYFLPAVAPHSVGIASGAHVHASAQLGEGCVIESGVNIGRCVQIGQRCHIMPGVVVMDHSRIGDDCVLFPNVTLYERTQLGNRVLIHSGTVLGAYGFGYRQHQGQHIRTAQLGNVVIEDDVELGAGVTIDRGTYGSTRIGTGTKIDNQVMIGHNCQIGQHNLLCSQVGIAGSCSTGNYVVLAGQVGLKDHIHLGDGAIVGAQAGVMEDLPGGQVYLGSPATTQREQMQIMAVQRRLPEMRRSLKHLERSLANTASKDTAAGERAA